MEATQPYSEAGGQQAAHLLPAKGEVWGDKPHKNSTYYFDIIYRRVFIWEKSMLKDRDRLRRRKSDGDLSLDIMDEEERNPLLFSRIKLPRYQSADILTKEEKTEYKSLYILSDEEIIVIPISQLEQLRRLLEAFILRKSSCRIRLTDYCWNKLENFRRRYGDWIIILGFLAAGGFVVQGGYLLFREWYRSITKMSKASLKNWNTLLSRNSDKTCAIVYNAIAKCLRIPMESGLGQLELLGLSESFDPTCYKALYDLCAYSCDADTALAKDCTGSNASVEFMAGAFVGVSVIVLMVVGFIALRIVLYCCQCEKPRRSPQETRLFRFSMLHSSLLKETKVASDQVENMLKQTENEIRHANFFKNRQQLIAEKLPTFGNSKANLAEIVDEYLGISIR